MHYNSRPESPSNKKVWPRFLKRAAEGFYLFFETPSKGRNPQGFQKVQTLFQNFPYPFEFTANPQT